MASTYSPLKIELIGTGEQAGTWGTTTNTNLGTALEEAITGSADVSFSSADVTLTLTNSNASQAGRNLRLNLTGTSGGARNLILGSGMQIEKLYLINNALAHAVTVKNTTGTGIAVPAGKSMFVFNNGTNVVDAITHLSSLTLGSALPVASGGTGITAFGTGVATALGQNVTGSGGIALATSPSFTTPTLGVASATSINKLTITAPATSATLTVANGKTLTANASLTLAGTDATTMTFPSTSQTIAGLGVAQTFTANQTITGNLILGTQTNKATLTYATNTARTLTFPNVGGNRTFAFIDEAQTFSATQTFGTVNATTFDTNVAAAGVTLAGTTLAADGTDSNISITVTPKGTGELLTASWLSGVFSDRTVALGNIGAALTLNASQGTVYTATLDQSGTLTLGTANATANRATSFTLILTRGAGGPFTLTLAGGTFRAADGTLSPTTTASSVDIWFFFTVDGGSNWYVSIPIKNAQSI